MKPCPYCAEEIDDEAMVCQFCGKAVAGVERDQVQATQSKDRRKEVTIKIFSVIFSVLSSLIGILLLFFSVLAFLDSLQNVLGIITFLPIFLLFLIIIINITIWRVNKGKSKKKRRVGIILILSSIILLPVSLLSLIMIFVAVAAAAGAY